MATTYTRVNSVLVDPTQARTRDAYLDAGWATTYASNTAQELSPNASSGGAYRGMPVAFASATAKIVPINVATAPASTSAAKYFGVLLSDITPFRVAANTKVGVAHAGRVRSYAAGSLKYGDPVKPDLSANFAGFSKWVEGTDELELLVGHAFPIADGSDGAAPATTMAQGDIIFVDLASH